MFGFLPDDPRCADPDVDAPAAVVNDAIATSTPSGMTTNRARSCLLTGALWPRSVSEGSARHQGPVKAGIGFGDAAPRGLDNGHRMAGRGRKGGCPSRSGGLRRARRRGLAEPGRRPVGGSGARGAGDRAPPAGHRGDEPGDATPCGHCGRGRHPAGRVGGPVRPRDRTRRLCARASRTSAGVGRDLRALPHRASGVPPRRRDRLRRPRVPRRRRASRRHARSRRRPHGEPPAFPSTGPAEGAGRGGRHRAARPRRRRPPRRPGAARAGRRLRPGALGHRDRPRRRRAIGRRVRQRGRAPRRRHGAASWPAAASPRSHASRSCTAP